MRCLTLVFLLVGCAPQIDMTADTESTPDPSVPAPAWVGWDGGPMMLIGAADFAAWNGAEPAEGEDSYQRALTALEAASPCTVDAGNGVALLVESSSEPYATWIPAPDGAGGIVAMLEFADALDAIPAYVADLGDDVWQDTGLVIELSGDHQLLLAAALDQSLATPEHCLPVALPRGRYAVTEAYVENDELGLTLFRLSR